jgi:hypothetical protein
MQARALHPAASQIESTEIRLPKVTVREVDVCNFHLAQIEAAKIAAPQVAVLAGFAAPIEFLAAPFAQQRI